MQLAAAYARAKDTPHEHKALRTALISDPSLLEDPDFRPRYERMKKAEAATEEEQKRNTRSSVTLRENPREGRNWGLGIDLLSTRGSAAFSVFLLLQDKLFPYLALDLNHGGLDAGIQWAFTPKRWSPFVGAGVRIPLKGAMAGEAETPWTPGFAVHLDVGWQFVGQNGVSANLGAGILIYRDDNGAATAEVLPCVGILWLL